MFDLSNCREGYLYDLAVRDLDLDAGCGERLGGLHTANCSTHTPAVGGNDLDVVLAVERLQSCERFSYFQNLISSTFRYLAFNQHGSPTEAGKCNQKLVFGV